jgi:hypothetical protein
LKKKQDNNSKKATEMSKLICENEETNEVPSPSTEASYLDDKNIIEK